MSQLAQHARKSYRERLASPTVTVTEFLHAKRVGNLEIENRFLNNLQVGAGVYKTTHAHRLDDTLLMLVALGETIRTRPLRVLDVGCSSGISTLEMHRVFADAGIRCETFGTDLVATATYVQRKDGCGVLFDSSCRILQIDIENWAVPWAWLRRPRPRKLDLLRTHHAIRLWGILTVYAADFRAAISSPLRGFRTENVSLLASSAETFPDITFLEEDFLAPTLTGQFHLIRAANILHGEYFEQSQLRAMAQSLATRLTPDGKLFVVRTIDGVNRGTMFGQANGKLTVEASMNGGSELDELMTR